MTMLTALVDGMVAAAAAAAAQRDWDTVKEQADDALLLSPGHPDALALAALARRHRPSETQGRRRQMTVMFCDVVGSTPLAERLDPETVNDVFTGFQEICAASVERYGGAIYQYIGDGALAYFSYPRAHEDDPRRAVYAGLDLQLAMHDYSASLVERLGVDLDARVGIHTGLVALGSLQVSGRTQSGAISGTTPNTAARIEAAATPGTVLMSDVTSALVEGYVDLEPIGPVALKGLAQPIRLYRALGRTAARSRLDVVGPRLSRFVGRESERAQLVRAWDATLRGWSPDAATMAPPQRPIRIVGDPGVGKSRLALGARRRAIGDGGMVIECSCEAFFNNPLEPFSDGIRRASGIATTDEPAIALDKLQEELEATGCADLLGVLARLIGVVDETRAPLPELSPLKLRAATVDAILRWIRSRAVLAPTMLLIDDLQWADESTAELVQTLFLDPPAGCLIVATSRPDSRHDFSETSEQIELTNLARSEAVELARESTGDRSPHPDVLAAIVERADGIPLFIEQLAAIARSESPPWGSAGAVNEIPVSLRDLFQTQLDSLGEALVVAQVAATIGRDFDADTLLEVHRRLEAEGERPVDGPWLQDALVRLSDAGLLVRRRVGGDRLRFRHALLGEAAYESQLLAERVVRHRAIAQVLLASASGASQPSLIARHFREAGQYPEAIAEHLRASENAGAAGEFSEALAQLDHAEQLLPKLDDPLPSELAIRMARGAARSASEGLAAVGLEAEFDRCVEICRELEKRESHDTLLANVNAGLWSYYITRGRIGDAAELTNGVARGADPADPSIPANVSSQRATELIFCGHWTEARQEFEAAVDAYSTLTLDRHRWVTPSDPYAASLALLGPVLAVTGESDRAHEVIDEAIRRSEQLPYPRGPYSVAFTRIYETWMHRMLGAYEQALYSANEALQIGAKYGFMDWQLLGQMHVFAAEARLELRGDGPHQMAPILAFWRQLGAGVGIPLFLVEQAELHVLAGELDSAKECLDEAFLLALNGGTHNDQPAPERLQQNELLAEAHRTRARMLAAEGAPTNDVRRELASAVAVAQSQGASLFALNAHLDAWELLPEDVGASDTLESLRRTVELFSPGSSFAQLDRARRIVAV